MSDFCQEAGSHGDSSSCRKDDERIHASAKRCLRFGMGRRCLRRSWSKVMKLGDETGLSGSLYTKYWQSSCGKYPQHTPSAWSKERQRLFIGPGPSVDAGEAADSNAESVIDGGDLDAALSAPGARMISLLITFHYLKMEISFCSLLLRIAEIVGEKFLWFGSKTETVSCRAGFSTGDAKLTETLLPGDILILRNSWRGWISFSNNKLKSDVPLPLCSRSSFVECCARQLHFHTVDSALKIMLASRHNLHSAVFPSFDFFNARFCASSLSSLLI